jgi:hypothetical protein
MPTAVTIVAHTVLRRRLRRFASGKRFLDSASLVGAGAVSVTQIARIPEDMALLLLVP